MRARSLMVGVLLSLAGSLTLSVQAGARLDIAPVIDLSTAQSRAEARTHIAMQRLVRYQESLGIDRNTLAQVLPIEEAHRARVREVLLDDAGKRATDKPRIRRKQVRQIERETIKELAPYLTSAQLTRWRRTYRMKALGSSHRFWNQMDSMNVTSTYGAHTTYVDYGSAYYQNGATNQAQTCD